MAAPASLSLAGYLTITQAPDINIISLLAGIAVLMTTVVYVTYFRLLRLPFSPAYAAFTFPMVIGSTALFKTAQWMQKINMPIIDIAVVKHAAMLELIIASVIVIYVCICYVNIAINSINERYCYER